MAVIASMLQPHRRLFPLLSPIFCQLHLVGNVPQPKRTAHSRADWTCYLLGKLRAIRRDKRQWR